MAGKLRGYGVPQGVGKMQKISKKFQKPLDITIYIC